MTMNSELLRINENLSKGEKRLNSHEVLTNRKSQDLADNDMN